MQKAKCVQSWQCERDKNGKRKEEISELLPALKTHVVLINTGKDVVMLAAFAQTAAQHLTAAQEDSDRCPSTDMLQQVD